ncbi:hypothetical protein LZC95_06245 [Pendulispora brunnea]|uniref:TNFR-Cys domain-containing protein n=1 Tax=Pendulispora brunnea TaxID=2905690 RepID=A0ABZ2KCS0_9BACT
MRISGYRGALLLLPTSIAFSAIGGACSLEGGGFGAIVRLPDDGDSAAEAGPLAPGDDASDATVADTGDSCPSGWYRCGAGCVPDCYKDCAQRVVCEATKSCVSACASCGTAKKVCYKCPDGLAPFASCENPKKECYGGVYTPCSCSTTPQSPSGDPSKCPGDDMVCLHLNEQNFVCKNCGDRETEEKTCGKTGSRKCEFDDEAATCR